MNPLIQLHEHGQSFWYDNIRRQFLEDGTLQALISNDGLRGMTSNPSIFKKAIGDSADYDAQLQTLATADINHIYETLAIADIQAACDLFLPLYKESNRTDGFVSLEVSPYLAHDTAGTIAEAQRLFATVNRPNLMIKVPATKAGIPAIQTLIGQGININVTLMFSMAHYEAVAQAYVDGLTAFVANGGDPTQVASVASFFISRVDTAVDNALNQHNTPPANALKGQIAIANAKIVYQRYREIFHGQPFANLRQASARPQRLLWASTSTKNPNYPDTYYVDELIGPETVNTMPPNTVDAFRNHGRVAQTITQNPNQAQQQLHQLAQLGINLDHITTQLQTDGIQAFSNAFDDLMQAITHKKAQLTTQP